MSAQVCPSCSAWVLLPRVPDDEIGVHPLRMPQHKRGKVKTADWCPAGGSVVKVLAEKACPRCGKGYEGEHTFDCLDGAA